MSFGEGISEGSAVEKLLFHLNGNSNDDSGNGFNGVDTNVTHSLANGKFNQGAEFTTATSKISIADRAALQFTSNFTISFWMYTTNNDSLTHSYIWKARVVAGSYTGVHVGRETDRRLRFVTYNGGTSLTVLYSTGSSYINNWYHIVCTKDSGGILKLYINGKLDNQTTGSSMQYSTEPFLIGIAQGDAWPAYANLDEVRVRTRVLTQLEIQKEYTNALGRF